MNKIKTFFVKKCLSVSIRCGADTKRYYRSNYYFQWQVREFITYLKNHVEYLLNAVLLDTGLDVIINQITIKYFFTEVRILMKNIC